MKIFNVGIIGYGKMGKIYVSEIKKTRCFKVIDILDYRKIKKNPDLAKKFFYSRKINIFIISSPIETHFEYLKHAFKSKKNIIIEKPLVENLSQLQKIKQINRNFKKKFLIHHNDVLNIEKLKLLQKNNTYNLKKIEMFYGCNGSESSYKKPILDWLPHPLSVIINFFGEPINFKILEYSQKLEKDMNYEKIKIFFRFRNFPIFVNFSNNLKKPTKKIILYKKNRKITYDGYKLENQRSIKLLLEKFQKIKKINDVKLNYKVYDILFKIEKKLVDKNLQANLRSC